MISVAIPPYAEPVSLAEQKNHCKVELSVTEDDSLIQSQITAARDVVETATGANVHRNMVMMVTTFEMKQRFFSAWGVICIPRVPLVSVESITYVDTAGTTQTLATSVYSVDTAGGRVILAYSQSWPSLRAGLEDRITVRFIAGMAAPFTAVAATDIITVLGRSFTVGDRVRVLNSGGQLPTGLQANTDYFVIAGPKLSLTAGGSTVDITGTGSGTHYIGGDLTAFETGRAALKLMAAHMYVNREVVNVGNIVTPFPMAIDSLIASIHA